MEREVWLVGEEVDCGEEREAGRSGLSIIVKVLIVFNDGETAVTWSIEADGIEVVLEVEKWGL